MDPNPSQPIFAGEFRHALDAKKRVTIPARWRSGEVDEFFAVPNPENGCLMVMPVAVAHEVAARAKSDPRFSAQDVQRFSGQPFAVRSLEPRGVAKSEGGGRSNVPSHVGGARNLTVRADPLVRKIGPSGGEHDRCARKRSHGAERGTA
jgi:hypothetical protein